MTDHKVFVPPVTGSNRSLSLLGATNIPALTSTDYVNTIPTELEPWFPGDEDVERRYRTWIRWNAAIMCTARNGRAWVSVDISRPTRRRPLCTRSASTTSSAASRIQAAAGFDERAITMLVRPPDGFAEQDWLAQIGEPVVSVEDRRVQSGAVTEEMNGISPVRGRRPESDSRSVSRSASTSAECEA